MDKKECEKIDPRISTYSDSLKALESMADLCVKHKLTSIEFGVMKITKDHHEGPIVAQKKLTAEEIKKIEEEELYHSSGGYSGVAHG